jgi:hypothetical protein
MKTFGYGGDMGARMQRGRIVGARSITIAAVVASVMLVAGCGGVESTSSSGTPEERPTADTARFIALGNQVCATVRQGLPAPVEGSMRPSRLARYARAALAPTTRTLVSLGRLPAPASVQPKIRELIRAQRDLKAQYEAVAQGGRAARGGMPQILEREQRADGLAMAVGLTGCAGRRLQ